MWETGPATLAATVELDGQYYTLGEASTAELFAMISSGNWLAIVPGLLDDADTAALASRVNDLDDPLDYADLYALATEAGARLAGALYSPTDNGTPTPNWSGAVRLLATVASRWLKFDGWCVAHGFDPLAGPLWRITSAAYRMLREGWEEGADPRRKAMDLARLDTQIWLTPMSVATTVTSAPALARHTVDQEKAAARAMLAEIRGGGVPPA